MALREYCLATKPLTLSPKPLRNLSAAAATMMRDAVAYGRNNLSHNDFETNFEPSLTGGGGNLSRTIRPAQLDANPHRPILPPKSATMSQSTAPVPLFQSAE